MLNRTVTSDTVPISLILILNETDESLGITVLTALSATIVAADAPLPVERPKKIATEATFPSFYCPLLSELVRPRNEVKSRI